MTSDIMRHTYLCTNKKAIIMKQQILIPHTLIAKKKHTLELAQ